MAYPKRKIVDKLPCRDMFSPVLMGGVVTLTAFSLLNIFLPQNKFITARNQILNNPNDYQPRLVLAEELLNRNQFQKAKLELQIAQKIAQTKPLSVLGSSSWQDDLFERYKENDPEEILTLISKWYNAITDNQEYRDGYLKLAQLYIAIGKTDQAREKLAKAVKIDPNYPLSLEMKKLLQ
jgi:tetratricopeptide (TPR) repeat protein